MVGMERHHSDIGIQLHSAATIACRPFIFVLVFHSCELDLCIDEVLHGLHTKLLQELNFLAFHLK